MLMFTAETTLLMLSDVDSLPITPRLIVADRKTVISARLRRNFPRDKCQENPLARNPVK